MYVSGRLALDRLELPGTVKNITSEVFQQESTVYKVKVKQSRYRPEVAQRVPGS
jgi:hypothetical protein